MIEPLLVGTQDSGRILGISTRQVEYLIACGELPTRKIGRRRLIPFSALKTFARKDTPVVPKPQRRTKDVARQTTCQSHGESGGTNGR